MSDSVKKVVATMSPVQFYKWQAQAEVMQHNKTRLLLAHAQHGNLNRDAEIARLKADMFKTRVHAVHSQSELAEKEFALVRAELEKELKVDLSKCGVDPLSFEVVELEEQGKAEQPKA